MTLSKMTPNFIWLVKGVLRGLSAYGLFSLGAGGFLSALTCSILELAFGLGLYVFFRAEKCKTSPLSAYLTFDQLARMSSAPGRRRRPWAAPSEHSA